MKISTFINKNKSTSDDFVKILDNIDDEEQNQHNINERIENLKIEFKEQQKTLIIIKYNKKYTIYEYLNRLNENGKRKVKVNKEAVQFIFINYALYKVKSI